MLLMPFLLSPVHCWPDDVLFRDCEPSSASSSRLTSFVVVVIRSFWWDDDNTSAIVGVAAADAAVAFGKDSAELVCCGTVLYIDSGCYVVLWSVFWLCCSLMLKYYFFVVAVRPRSRVVYGQQVAGGKRLGYITKYQYLPGNGRFYRIFMYGYGQECFRKKNAVAKNQNKHKSRR